MFTAHLHVLNQTPGKFNSVAICDWDRPRACSSIILRRVSFGNTFGMGVLCRPRLSVGKLLSRIVHVLALYLGGSDMVGSEHPIYVPSAYDLIGRPDSFVLMNKGNRARGTIILFYRAPFLPPGYCCHLLRLGLAPRRPPGAWPFRRLRLHRAWRRRRPGANLAFLDIKAGWVGGVGGGVHSSRNCCH